MVLENEVRNEHNEITTIQVTIYVRNRLQELKHRGDSFNTVIQRLMEAKQ